MTSSPFRVAAVHAQGDGSTLDAYATPVGRLGGLICWENSMPPARYALYARGVDLYAAPTWDRGEPWLSTLRHIAKEGRVVVVGSCSAMRLSDIRDRLAFKTQYLTTGGDWLNPGESAIVDPDGKVVAGPARCEETILYADIEPAQSRVLAGSWTSRDIMRARTSSSSPSGARYFPWCVSPRARCRSSRCGRTFQTIRCRLIQPSAVRS